MGNNTVKFDIQANINNDQLIKQFEALKKDLNSALKSVDAKSLESVITNANTATQKIEALKVKYRELNDSIKTMNNMDLSGKNAPDLDKKMLGFSKQQSAQIKEITALYYQLTTAVEQYGKTVKEIKNAAKPAEVSAQTTTAVKEEIVVIKAKTKALQEETKTVKENYEAKKKNIDLKSLIIDRVKQVAGTTGLPVNEDLIKKAIASSPKVAQRLNVTKEKDTEQAVKAIYDTIMNGYKPSIYDKLSKTITANVVKGGNMQGAESAVGSVVTNAVMGATQGKTAKELFSLMTSKFAQFQASIETAIQADIAIIGEAQREVAQKIIDAKNLKNKIDIIASKTVSKTSSGAEEAQILDNVIKRLEAKAVQEQNKKMIPKYNAAFDKAAEQSNIIESAQAYHEYIKRESEKAWKEYEGKQLTQKKTAQDTIRENIMANRNEMQFSTGFSGLEKSIEEIAAREKELQGASQRASEFLYKQTSIMDKKTQSALKLSEALHKMSDAELEVYNNATKYNQIDPEMAKRYKSYSTGSISNYGQLSKDAAQVALGIGVGQSGKSNELDMFKGQRSASFASNLLRDLQTKAQSVDEFGKRFDVQYANVYQKALDSIVPNITNRDGSLKDNATLENYFKSNDFRRIVMKRLQSNVGGLEKAVIDQAGQGVLDFMKAHAQDLYANGQAGMGAQSSKYYANQGPIGNIISGRKADNSLDFFGGTEDAWLQSLTMKDNRTKPKGDFIKQYFDVNSVKSFEGAMKNALERFRQFGDEFPNVLQNINLTFTKAAFAISRVAYGMRVVFMELNVMRQMFTQGFSMAINKVQAYTDYVVKATETQRKAGIVLEGVFDKSTSKQMMAFARSYAVTSPATFDDITNMIRGFGLNPAMKGMIEKAKEQGQMEKKLQEMAYVTVGLGMTKPEQGVKGASFTLREAMAGQFTSLKRRFEISPEAMAAAIGKSTSDIKKSPELFMQAAKAFLDLNIGESTLKKLSYTYQVQMQNIKDFMEQASAMIGESGFYDNAVKMITKVANSFQMLLGTDFFKGQMKSVSNALTGYMATVFGTINNTMYKLLPKDAQKERSADLYKQGYKQGFFGQDLDSYVQQGLVVAGVFDLIAKAVETMGKVVKNVGEYFAKLLDGWSDVLTGGVDIVDVIGQVAKTLAEIFNSLAKTYFSYIKEIVNPKLGLGTGLQGLAIFFATFPVASANIVINTMRALFETTLALSNTKNWEAAYQAMNMLKGITGTGLNLGMTIGNGDAAVDTLNTMYATSAAGSKKIRELVAGGNLDALGDGLTNLAAPAWMQFVSKGAAYLRGAGAALLVSALISGFIAEWNNQLSFTQNMWNGMIGTFQSLIGLAKIFADHWIISGTLIYGLLNMNKLLIIGADIWAKGFKFDAIMTGMKALFSSTMLWVGGLMMAAGAINSITAKLEEDKRLAPYDQAKLMAKQGNSSPQAIKDAMNLELVTTAASKGGITVEEVQAIQTRYDKIAEVITEARKNAKAKLKGGVLPSFEDIAKEIGTKRESLQKKSITDYMFSDEGVVVKSFNSFGNYLKNIGKDNFLGSMLESLKFKQVDLKDTTAEATTALKEQERSMLNGKDAAYELANKVKDAKAALDALSLSKDMNKALASKIQQAYYNPEVNAAVQLAEKYKKQTDEGKIEEIDKSIAILKKQNGVLQELKAEILEVRALSAIEVGVKWLGMDVFMNMLRYALSWVQTFASMVVNIPINLAFGSSGSSFMEGAKGVASNIFGGSALGKIGGVIAKNLGFNAGISNFDEQIKDLNAAKTKVGEGGANKASELEKKYYNEKAKLNKEMLEAEGKTLQARIESARFESKERIAEYEKEFKGSKYYREMMTLVGKAETAKLTKAIKDEMKSINEAIINSKWLSPEIIMKAFNTNKLEEFKEKINNINYAMSQGFISQAEGRAVKQDYLLATQAEAIEKRYEVLKNQPTLVDLLGGKDAEKILESFNVNLLKYVGTLNKVSTLHTDLGATTWKVLGTEKIKEGNRTTTIKTSELEGKITGANGAPTKAGVDVMSAMNKLQEMYYKNSITMLKLEIDKEKELSELQLKRYRDTELINGLTKDQIRSMRDQIAEVRLLAQAEEQYYKNKEMWIRNTGSLQDQMTFTWQEQIRKLPKDAEVVKSSTESMFSTMKDGMSNVLVAAFQGDTQKMKDTWNEFITSLKNTFLKMIADLIVNNLFKSIFGGFMKGDEQNIANSVMGGTGSTPAPTGMGSVPMFGQLFNAMNSNVEVMNNVISTSTNTLSSSTDLTINSLDRLTQAFESAAQRIAASAGGSEEDGGGFLGSLFGGSMGSLGDSILSSDTGGAAGIFAGIAGGSIAGNANGTPLVSSPTLSWIGEGRYNEAVIPLPDGKSVPVQSIGGNKQETPVEVTVINLINDDAINAAIMRKPNVVINVIDSNIQQNGSTARLLKNKR